ncbi:MAG TPA: UDP-N-acetylmuramoyl-L-alanyl-D-glutamate--2,6-diaminopimelate ligase [Nocardioidaceae bacterium]|nr:UDP-N-acetylmuramoyl-L-alanyl-D-glutamate--2,6-diaminopimelate ligase [Nocardioidaceae bacterium]
MPEPAMDYPIDPRPSVLPRYSLPALVELLGGELRTLHESDPQVSGVTLDSRQVRPGDLYAALPGATVHGASFVDAAVAAGAAAVLTDAAGAERITAHLPVWVVERPRTVLGRVAATVHGRPADRLRSIGVTGTHGKTTTCFMLEAGLVGAGATAGLVGTVGTRIAGWSVKTTLTTPEAPDLHALFAVMVERGVEAVAMEVSSHALVMGRVDGVVFDVAVFTNLGRDHLDFHADIEDYFQAKAQLFTPERARRGLVNIDDLFGRRLLEQTAPDGIPMRTFSPSGGDADWRVEDVDARPDGSDMVIVAPDGSRHPLRLTAPGRFNIANALAAVAALGEAGLDVAGAVAGVSEVTGIPGRMESIRSGLGFTVVVDYAHKPDAVTAVLSALRPVTSGRLITVIGAGGDRDRGKRPIMGEIAARLSDVLVVTDDNPRTEDAAAIRSEVIGGIDDVLPTERAEIVEIGDRRAAIAAALAQASPGDCVLVAGKGHEPGQEIAGVVHPFDDRDVVRTVLARMAEEANHR